jgi:hypothetical protein
MTVRCIHSLSNSGLLKQLNRSAVALQLQVLPWKERPMIAAIPESQIAYAVEVSGWDNNQDFFVEKTELHWSEQSGKHILLSRPIISGALVFLRLIDPTSIDRVHPVPYRAEPFATTEAGHRRVRLLPARQTNRAS